jgi:hypothetical protein
MVVDHTGYNYIYSRPVLVAYPLEEKKEEGRRRRMRMRMRKMIIKVKVRIKIVSVTTQEVLGGFLFPHLFHRF